MEAESIDHSVAPSLTAGANIIFIQSVKLCQKERTKLIGAYA